MLNKGPRAGSWSAAEQARLRELVGTMSFEQIAQRLNAQFGTTRTKNSVIGGWHRLQGLYPQQKAATRPKLPPGMRLARPSPAPPRPPQAPYALFELTARHCRWIDGDPAGERPFACNDPAVAPGGPYCLGHSKRAWGRHTSPPAARSAGGASHGL